MLYKNVKKRVCSVDDAINFFDFVAWLLQEDTLSPYMLIICQAYVL